MRKDQKKLLTVAAIFMLLLLSYRYSLYQSTPQIPYLMTPESITPFQKLITYFFMTIGIFPTILIMIVTSTLCHTINPAGTVQTLCFGTVFSLSDSNGFIAYIVASILTLITGWYIYSNLTDSLHD